MANRYRRDDFLALLPTMPKHLRRWVGWQAAPPGYVKAAFGTEEAERWVTERLGPSVEPDDAAPFVTDRDKRPGKWPARGG